ncbi:unnamed protein product [Spirodela intermedia]|uniref:Uncharacterized protein n=1 Tax=Spirodela intermedia TaxID=51605 RepID=A0A7I8L793_SPIIN|nr:unnamed protein product [Spirodela intermedia]
MATARSLSIFMALAVLLASVAFPACCDIPSDAVSYKFYYNPDWRAYFFGDAECTGSASNVVSNSIDCVNEVTFKSALLTDESSIEMVTEKQPPIDESE